MSVVTLVRVFHLPKLLTCLSAVSQILSLPEGSCHLILFNLIHLASSVDYRTLAPASAIACCDPANQPTIVSTLRTFAEAGEYEVLLFAILIDCRKVLARRVPRISTIIHKSRTTTRLPKVDYYNNLIDVI